MKIENMLQRFGCISLFKPPWLNIDNFNYGFLIWVCKLVLLGVLFGRIRMHGFWDLGLTDELAGALFFDCACLFGLWELTAMSSKKTWFITEGVFSVNLFH